MLRKTLFLIFAATLLVLAMPSTSEAWYAYHYSYHSGGYGGGARYGYHSGGYHYGGGARYGYGRRW